jgi:hypothetical protein
MSKRCELAGKLGLAWLVWPDLPFFLRQNPPDDLCFCTVLEVFCLLLQVFYILSL